MISASASTSSRSTGWRAALERHPRMKERCFSAEERAYCDRRNRPEVHYALRFAAKEAVLKALGHGLLRHALHRRRGRARRRRAGRRPGSSGARPRWPRSSASSRCILSLSFTHTNAVASAVAMTAEEPRPAAGADAGRSACAASFKDARSHPRRGRTRTE